MQAWVLGPQEEDIFGCVTLTRGVSGSSHLNTPALHLIIPGVSSWVQSC